MKLNEKTKLTFYAEIDCAFMSSLTPTLQIYFQLIVHVLVAINTIIPKTKHKISKLNEQELKCVLTSFGSAFDE